MSYEIHPLAELIPSMSADEFAELKADIAENGVKSPITLFDGRILDGRHRYRACADLGITPAFVEYEGDEPARFVISLNLKRRNLSKSQLAMTAAEFLPALEEEAQKRAEAGRRRGGEEGGRSRPKASPQNREEADHRNSKDGLAATEAAEITGASTRYVQAAKRVSEADPDLAEKVKAGDISLDAAERQVSGVSRPKGRASGLDTKEDASGRKQPATFYGKGDKWQEASEPLARYLAAHEKRGYDFSHLNFREARKRVDRIKTLMAGLEAALVDLEPRTEKAKLSL